MLRVNCNVRSASLSVIVGNDSMGVGDSVPGVRKEVTVVYQYRGRERRATAREGGTLNLPQETETNEHPRVKELASRACALRIAAGE